MPLHDLRTRVRESHLVATGVGITSPAVVEALSYSEFDAVLLDAEHAPMAISDIENLIRAADVGGMPVIVRVPEVGSYISRVLDAGASGIVVPRVETAAQAAQVVDRARHAPVGSRGVGPGRGVSYGASMLDYARTANDKILIAVQIETRAGFEAREAILATPGIDAVAVGPFDLAVSMGVELGSPEHRAAITEILETTSRHGVARGTFTGGLADVGPALEMGARLIVVGFDLGYVIAGAAETWAHVSGLLGRSQP